MDDIFAWGSNFMTYGIFTSSKAERVGWDIPPSLSKVRRVSKGYNTANLHDELQYMALKPVI